MILIMAAGEASRFGGGCKQFLPVGRETILGRLQRQLEDRGYRPIVVTHRERIKKRSHRWVEPMQHLYLCHSILSTQDLWGERTIVLLGDVLYSKQALDTILDYSGNMMFFGNMWEVFGLSFQGDDHERLRKALAKGTGVWPGKLGTLHNILIDKLGYAHGQSRMDSPIFVHITDWTRDIDSQEEYVVAINELVNENQLDDLPQIA